MRITLSILLISVGLVVNAQQDNCILKSGQLNLRVNSDGNIAVYNSSPSSEFAEGSNNHLFKFINVWVSGFSDTDNLHITTVNGFTNKNDYSQGPLDSLTEKGAEPDDFKKVWHITSTDIYKHITNFTKTGYTPTEDIETWPANGFARFNKYLAPFADNDQNGKYEPEKGDYPLIEGDNAAFFILNDNYSEHKASVGQPLKIELYCMLYSYNSMPNTVFAKYYIKNPTNIDFKDVIVSLNTAFELGNKDDNYCGTSVSANSIFSYNGDDNDDNHFGKNKPIAMISFLGKNLKSSVYITNDNDSLSGMPTTPFSHRNMMEGKWKNSKNISFGNDGKSNEQNSKYVYSGSTDPDFASQNWTENALPGTRTMLANTEIGELKSKNYITLDFAICGTDNTGNTPYDFVFEKYIEIKNQWLSKSASVKKYEDVEKLLILKNPITQGENIYKNEFNKFDKITVINSYGVLIKEINPRLENELKLYETGLFFIKYSYGNQVYIKKIVII